MTRAEACVFCDIIAGDAPAQRVAETPHSVLFVPLSPVTAGHVLVVPRIHVADAAEHPGVTGKTMSDAAVWASRQGAPFNLIASAGRAATQSIWHLHVHYVPRAVDDQLMVPWGTLYGTNPADPHRCKRIVELERELAERHGS